jgi:murein DD-endopeptidase MepM/ murein hydrolase activator NlpD
MRQRLLSPRGLLIFIPVLASLACPLSVNFSRSKLQAGNLLLVRLDLAPDDEFVSAWKNDQPCVLHEIPGSGSRSFLICSGIDLESPPPQLHWRFQTRMSLQKHVFPVRGPSRIPTGFVQLGPSGKKTLLDDPVAIRRENEYFRLFFRRHFSGELHARGPWSLPIPDRVVGSEFGKLREYDNGARSYHKGVDFPLAEGTPVFAVSRGRVCHSGPGRLRGELVIIDHGATLLSSYWHLAKRVVREGDWVLAGQKIGEVGTTGLSTGPHLHFELRADGVLVDGLNLYDLDPRFTF